MNSASEVEKNIDLDTNMYLENLCLDHSVSCLTESHVNLTLHFLLVVVLAFLFAPHL